MIMHNTDLVNFLIINVFTLNFIDSDKDDKDVFSWVGLLNRYAMIS